MCATCGLAGGRLIPDATPQQIGAVDVYFDGLSYRRAAANRLADEIVVRTGGRTCWLFNVMDAKTWFVLPT